MPKISTRRRSKGRRDATSPSRTPRTPRTSRGGRERKTQTRSPPRSPPTGRSRARRASSAYRGGEDPPPRLREELEQFVLEDHPHGESFASFATVLAQITNKVFGGDAFSPPLARLRTRLDERFVADRLVELNEGMPLPRPDLRIVALRRPPPTPTAVSATIDAFVINAARAVVAMPATAEYRAHRGLHTTRDKDRAVLSWIDLYHDIARRITGEYTLEATTQHVVEQLKLLGDNTSLPVNQHIYAVGPDRTTAAAAVRRGAELYADLAASILLDQDATRDHMMEMSLRLTRPARAVADDDAARLASLKKIFAPP